MKLATLEVDLEKAKDIVNKFDNHKNKHIPWLKAIIAGNRVVDIEKTMHQAGLNKQGFPALAIVSIDEKYCYYQRGESGHFLGTKYERGIIFPKKTFRRSFRNTFADSVRAEVPPIPSEVVNKCQQGDLVVWEVDKWHKPKKTNGEIQFSTLDPVILRPISGNIMQVVAEWDLTPLEKELFGSLMK